MLRQSFFTIWLALLYGLCALTPGLAQITAKPPATGVITGRITRKGQPAPAVTVLLIPANDFPYRRQPQAQAITDEEGRYRLTGLPAGSYNLQPTAPAYVVQGEGGTDFNGRPKVIILTDGETISDIDFTLIPGGVITGKVTNDEGKPLISERIQVEAQDRQGNGRWLGALQYRFSTDDRGQYRVYGLPAGRYIVSAGREARQVVMNGSSQFYPQTFHPKAVEVTEGGETTGVDIVLAAPEQSFQARGRVIDAVTGEPAAGVSVRYGRIEWGGFNGFGTNSRTDAQGRFAFEGLTAGEYGVFLDAYGPSEANYSNVVKFTIAESNVGDLELKKQRGITLNGAAVIEGTEDFSLLPRLQTLQLFSSQTKTGDEVTLNIGRALRIEANGSFHIIGLRPGRVNIQLPVQGGSNTGFRLLRIEQNGVPVPLESLEVKAGTDINDVRLVFEYGAGCLIGQLNYTNGPLGENDHIAVLVRHTEEKNLHRSFMDSQGRFVVEGLKAGAYNISIILNRPGSSRTVTQKEVFVAAEGDTKVDIMVDLAKPAEPGERP